MGAAEGTIESTIQIMLCDDEQRVLNMLERAVTDALSTQDLHYRLQTTTDPRTVLSLSGQNLDILFLDVEMPEMDGFTVAHLLNEMKSDAKIIFLTRHKHRVQEAFKVRAYRYLYKPMKRAEVAAVLAEAIDDIRRRERFLVAEVGTNAAYLVRFEDIEYIESIGDHRVIYANEEKVVTRSTLRQLMDKLDGRFYQCHRTFVVNMNWVHAVTDTECTMRSGITLPVSTRSKYAFKRVFHEYMLANAR